jgi:23S rRNA (guanosine2251-2'-O)-methyltransferase
VAEGSQEKGRLAEILKLAAGRRIPVERVPRTRLDKISDHHQGVALEASAYPYSHLQEILELAGARLEPPFLLLLDTLQDPQNLGTLLRTAEAAGVHGVILPLAHTATITPAVVNASSGACEHLFITQANLAQTIASLKDKDIWVVGLEGGPLAQPLGSVRLDGGLALVVGNEGEGMRQLVRDSCDVLLSLPMRGQVASLNAAVAGSLALYFVWQARKFTGS